MNDKITLFTGSSNLARILTSSKELGSVVGRVVV
jgi:hypothetical protein